MLKIPNTIYGNSSGDFGRIFWRRKDVIDYIEWLSCRDAFLLENVKSFLFCARFRAGRRVIRFINKIEDMLGLEKRLQIEPTSIADVLLVKLTSFWYKKHCKSLLTALLRAGQDYDRSLYRALAKSRYFEHTMPAVKLFLDGHTKLKKSYDFVGWVDNFIYMDEETAGEILIILHRLKKLVGI